jgi:4a-hydroxytetrahydrobiopterin dehydratase
VSLADERCVPCRPGTPPVDPVDVPALLAALPGWTIAPRDGIPRIERVYRCPDFARALALTNRIGALAEAAGHHPALLTEWGRVTVGWWTHAIGGLHRNDFVMAARTDQAAREAGLLP